MTSTQIVPAIVIPFIAWRVYRRVQRNVGRQPFQPRRLVVRLVILALITGLIGMAAANYPAALTALAGGLALGVPLAMLGLHLTRFEATPTGKFYTPNTALGVALIVLFVGRMAYRMFLLFGSSPTGTPPPTPFSSPLTLAIFGVTAGYYLAYSIGVLRRGKRLAAPAAGT